MAGHTPGPWHAISDTVYSGGRAQYFVASCDVGVANMANREANAHLIAAAPDLLEAAKSALVALRMADPLLPPEIIALEAAIAKAEGSQ